MTDKSLESAVETVRHLLASLPERPRRLRVQAAGVIVDLDWRSASAPAAVHVEQAPVVKDEPALSSSYFVCAPAIGTFYHAPEPGKPPFVEPGGLVEEGQQVGIIEAMKLMLPVDADRQGRVLAVLVADGQAVEYGEQLIELGPVDSG